MLLLANVDDRVGKLLVSIHDVLPAIPIHQVRVACHHHNIHRPGEGGVIQLESMVQVRNKSSLYGNIVHVELVTTVAWGREEVVEDIRDNNLHSVIRGVLVGLVPYHAGGAEVLGI